MLHCLSKKRLGTVKQIDAIIIYAFRNNLLRRMFRMKCSNCGHGNSVPVNKVFLEQPSPEPKVKVMIPMYEPLETSKWEKCSKIIAKPKELIRIKR